MFARLYGTDDEQVLVKLGTDEDGCPEIRFYAEPPNLGVCEISIGFKDTDAGWVAAERTMAQMNEETARSMAKRILGGAAKFT